MLCLSDTQIKILISNWPRTRKFSQLGYYRQGRQLLLTLFWSLKRFWPYLIVSRSCISNGKPEYFSKYLCLFFFLIFLISRSRAQFMRLVCALWIKIWDNDLTYSMRFDLSLQNFKKALVDIFSLQIERKKRCVIILAVERKLWAIFSPGVHLWKQQTPGSRLKT